MDISEKRFLILIIIVIFTLGSATMVASLYVAMRDGIGFPLATFSILGFSLLIMSFIIYGSEYLGYQEIEIRGKSYSLKRNGEDEIIGSNVDFENLDAILPILNQISDQLTEQEDQISQYYDKTPIQQVIDIVNKQLAIREYINSVGDQSDLRVVKFDEGRIVAESEEELDLTEGLFFNILSDDDEAFADGRIGKARLSETESSSGKLFEFELTEWKTDSEDWISRAKIDLSEGHARMSIITDGLVEVDEEKLETALECLQLIKYDRELEYDY